MKFLAIAFGILTTVSVYANDPSVFVGRYRVIGTNECDRESGSRAYVSITKYVAGIPAVLIQYFGTDTKLVSIPVGNGKIISQNGQANFTEILRSRWSGSNLLSSQSSTQGANFNKQMTITSEFTLQRNGSRLTIINVQNGAEVSRCELSSY